MEPLAKPALQAVADGTIKLLPERFERVYNNWLDNIKVWAGSVWEQCGGQCEECVGKCVEGVGQGRGAFSVSTAGRQSEGVGPSAFYNSLRCLKCAFPANFATGLVHQPPAVVGPPHPCVITPAHVSYPQLIFLSYYPMSHLCFQDWCISRQLWWGHRIPVWYVHDSQEAADAAEGGCSSRYIVARNEQEALSKAKTQYGEVRLGRGEGEAEERGRGV